MATERPKRMGRRRLGRWGAALPLGLLTLEDRTVPTTFYVDPALTGSASFSTVTYNNGYPGQQSGLVYGADLSDYTSSPNTVNAFSDLRTAISASEAHAGADTILVAQSKTNIPLDNSTFSTQGGYDLNSVAVTQPLTITGSGAGASIVAPTTNTQYLTTPGDPTTATDDDGTSVFRVAGAGASLAVSNLTLDGSGKNLGFGFVIRDGAAGSFDSVTVRNVAFAAGDGTAITASAAANLTVTNATVSGYGRSGLVFINTNGSVSGSAVTGSGDSTVINNGIEVQDASTVRVTGTTVSGNIGRVGGAESAGVLVALVDPGTAPVVTLIGNTIDKNAVGVIVGDGVGDPSTVIANYNNIAQNDTGVDGTNATTTIDARNNFWGDATGPFDSSKNPSGTGNPAPGNVLFQPFLSTTTPVISATSNSDYLAKIATVGTTVALQSGTTNPVPRPAVTTDAVAFTVTFAQAVTGFDPSDVTVTGGAVPAGGATVSVSPTSGPAAAYTITVSGLTGTGTVSVAVKANGATAADGYQNAGSNTATATFTATSPFTPTVTLAPGTTTPVSHAATGADAVAFTVTFPEAVTGFSPSSVAVSGAPVPAGGATIVVSGSGAAYTVTVSGLSGAGTVSLAVKASAVTGVGDNQTNTASNSASVTFVSPPVVPPTSPFTPTVTLAPGQTTPITHAATAADSVAFTVSFPEAVTGFSPSSLLVSGAVVPAGGGTVTVTGSGAAYTVTVAGLSGTGSVSVSVKAGTVTGVSDGQTNLASNTATVTFTPTTVSPPPPVTHVITLPLTAVGADVGGGPVVKVYNADGSLRASFLAFESTFTGGVRVAVADVNGDGIDDIIVGAGVGGGPRVRVYSGADLSILADFLTFEPTVRDGVYVAGGDLDGDGKAEIVVGAGTGGAPAIAVFGYGNDGTTQNGGGAFLKYRFFAFENTARGGVTVAVGDVDGDGKAEIIAGAGVGGAPAVAVFNGDGTGRYRFFAFSSDVRTGVFVGAGDLDGSGKADVIAGAGVGGGPQVRVVRGADGADLGSFFAYSSTFTGGVRVAAGDVTGDGIDEVITGPGPGGGPNVRGFQPLKSSTPVFSTMAFESTFTGGVFVG